MTFGPSKYCRSKATGMASGMASSDIGWSRNDAAARAPDLLPGKSKVALADRDLSFGQGLLGERSLEELARQRWQQRVGDDVVDHAAAGIRIVALRDDVVDHRLIIAE